MTVGMNLCLARRRRPTRLVSERGWRPAPRPSCGAGRRRERIQAKSRKSTASPWRGIAVVLSHQSLQRGRIVDIVPKRQRNEIEAKRGCPSARGCRNRATAPCDIGEQPRLGEAHPEEVVAPIIASSHHYTSLVAGEEGCGRADEDIGWKCRGVGA